MAMMGSRPVFLIILLYGGLILLPQCYGCTALYTQVQLCFQPFGNRLTTHTSCDTPVVQCLQALDPCESIDKLIKHVEYTCSDLGKDDGQALISCVWGPNPNATKIIENDIDECSYESGFNFSTTAVNRCMSAREYYTCYHGLIVKYCSGAHGDALRLSKAYTNGAVAYFCYKEENNFQNNQAFIGGVTAGVALIVIIIAAVILCVYVRRIKVAPPLIDDRSA